MKSFSRKINYNNMTINKKTNTTFNLRVGGLPKPTTCRLTIWEDPKLSWD